MSSSKAMFSAFQGIRKYTERTSRTETNHKLENSIAAKSPHRKSKNREREKERPPGAVRKRVQKSKQKQNRQSLGKRHTESIHQSTRTADRLYARHPAHQWLHHHVVAYGAGGHSKTRFVPPSCTLQCVCCCHHSYALRPMLYYK